MVTRLPEVDAVVIGMGWTGSIIARELTRAGLQVVGLERGPRRTPEEDFTLPGIRDELKYAVRQELFQDPQTETVSLRHASSETALPMRRFGAFLPGSGVGGAGAHWNGMHWRYAPIDLELRSRLTERYGRNAIPDEMTIADFGVSYDELEPYYDRFEKLCGVSGKAGNLRGRKIAGGNIFEGARRNEFPNRPLQQTLAGELFAAAAERLGFHPFPMPASNASAPYVNPEGLRLGACVYCGHCERFGCEVNAKASPNTTVLPVLNADARFNLRDHAYVRDLVYDRPARKVSAVRYVDTRSGREYEQPAGLVILGAYVFSNTLLMRVSGIGEPYDPQTGRGVVGKNYCYQVGAGVQVFVEDKALNPFMGAGALATAIDDFNGDNFDHGGLGFFGGAVISATTGGARPILSRPVPPGTPRWGAEWKRATAKWYGRSFSIGASGASYAHRENYLDLDPNYRDALGRPLVRMTYNFRENDRRLAAHGAEVVERIAKAVDGGVVARSRGPLGDFHATPYQSTHNTGGTIMGRDPKTSVVNRYLQAWDADNLFVLGASVFPQNASYNPTGTVGALAYWAADAIVGRYLKRPEALVQA
ncbi:GMC family oxidoreductase [Phenylobacterium sp. LjRoot225]|uniref:GMC family oxidoreductase n=1 Tax=Phenylobacterium sp. LjRoot225 TaxID=3342285 RepID=UPI003ECC434C